MFSFLLTMTAVICWSMKINIVPNNAGRHATMALHHGLCWKGQIIHPRPSNVGLNSVGTSNFGVEMPAKWSSVLIENIAIITAKSLTTCLTYIKEYQERQLHENTHNNMMRVMNKYFIILLTMCVKMKTNYKIGALKKRINA